MDGAKVLNFSLHGIPRSESPSNQVTGFLSITSQDRMRFPSLINRMSALKQKIEVGVIFSNHSLKHSEFLICTVQYREHTTAAATSNSKIKSGDPCESRCCLSTCRLGGGAELCNMCKNDLGYQT